MKDSLIFIHSTLDDFGLSASEFRVLAHISRRAGNGTCYASVPSMAKTCRLHPQTVRDAVRSLENGKLIKIEHREGQTSKYRISPQAEWGKPYRNEYPTEKDTGVSDSKGGLPKGIQGHPTGKDIDEGYPTEGNPKKEIQKAGAIEIPLHLNTGKFMAAWAEWQAYYPKRVRRKASDLTQTFQKQINNKLAGLTEADAIAWISNSIECHYQGLFPPKQITSGGGSSMSAHPALGIKQDCEKELRQITDPNSRDYDSYRDSEGQLLPEAKPLIMQLRARIRECDAAIKTPTIKRKYCTPNI